MEIQNFEAFSPKKASRILAESETKLQDYDLFKVRMNEALIMRETQGNLRVSISEIVFNSLILITASLS